MFELTGYQEPPPRPAPRALSGPFYVHLPAEMESFDAGLLLGRTERAARAAELQLCAQAR